MPLYLLAFGGLPGHAWASIAGAMLLGCLVLAAATKLKAEASGARRFWSEVARDIGIAFVVAAVVSVTYEYNTRSIADRETLLDTLNRAMKAFVEGNVWDEVRNQVLRRHAVRRNVQLVLRLTRKVPDRNGNEITLPPYQAALWVSYRYDLYGIAAGASQIQVRHELAWEMRDENLNLPRFEKVSVTGPGAMNRVYEGTTLGEVCDATGVMRLEGAHIVSLPSPSSGVPVRIETERYELVSTPGSYDLIMPELTARAEGSSDPTIRITFAGEIPSDVDVDLNTYYPPHSFTRPDRAKNEWLYSGILLPGQGLTLVFRRRSTPAGQIGGSTGAVPR